jgi:hypothetical protein
LSIFADNGMRKLGALLQGGASSDVASKTVDSVASMSKGGLNLSAGARKLLDAKAESIDVSALKLIPSNDRTAFAGGHLDKQIMVDEAGRKWMFKAFPQGQEHRALGENKAKS